MTETYVLLITTVVSFGLAIAGILFSRRSADEERRLRVRIDPRNLHALEHLENLGPRDRLVVTITLATDATDPVDFDVDMEPLRELFGHDVRVTKSGNVITINAGSPRSGSDERIVEVESRDGSKSALTVDPTDADSIGRFVEDARRIDTRRFVAVH